MSKQNFNPRDFDAFQSLALLFPGTEESVSYEGTPSVKLRGKLMCRLHDEGEFIVIRLDFPIRDSFLDRYPEVFHLPEHFKKWPYLAMHLHTGNRSLQLQVLEASWRGLASKTQLKQFEASDHKPK